MKKLIRLIPLVLAPTFLVVCLNALLAGQAGAGYSAPPPAPQIRPAAGYTLQPTQLISAVIVTHSEPTLAGLPLHFTATLTSTEGGGPSAALALLAGDTPPFFNWFFGDGESQASAGPTATHTYAAPDTYTVTVIAIVDEMNVVSDSIQVEVRASFQTRLPVIFKGFSGQHLPTDLVCDSLTASLNPSADEGVYVEVQMSNRGPVAVDGFWVDLYVNPTKVPTTGDLRRWEDACGDDTTCPTGIAWGIGDDPDELLQPQEERTLISVSSQFHPDGYDPANTVWTGSLPAGDYTFYAYVDSIENRDLDRDADVDGAIEETDETNNRCGPVNLVVPATGASAQQNWLPARQAP